MRIPGVMAHRSGARGRDALSEAADIKRHPRSTAAARAPEGSRIAAPFLLPPAARMLPARDPTKTAQQLSAAMLFSGTVPC